MTLIAEQSDSLVPEITSEPLLTGSPRILITLCTYNERENLQQLIPQLLELLPNADILVIDDNSPDGTGPFVEKLTADDVRIHVIHRPGKLGLGSATTAGFQYGIENGYDLLVNLDADFSHPPRFIPSMIDQARETDVVIGSRYVPGGNAVGLNATRWWMSWSLNVYARMVLGLTTQDNSGSFRCYRVNRLAEVDWSRTRATGYAIQEEILFRLRQAGASFVEVPISYEERRFGHSKLNWKEAALAGSVLLKLRLWGN
ncbi:MAG TPA: polyprenol monophosphomannose synthase [Planctomicrobium sp.]|nr:polyprenol monophosphomannose synthase [Planctomicrobium sp.]